MRIRLPTIIQSTVDNYLGVSCEQEQIPAFGGDIKTKEDGTLRVGSQNVNGLNLRGSINSGAEEIDAMETLGLDVMGLVETNVKLSHEAKNKLSAMI